jgi:hypothetical protein
VDVGGRGCVDGQRSTPIGERFVAAKSTSAESALLFRLIANQGR